MTKTNIIDSVIPQTRSRELVRQMIPILIRWAKQGQTDNTYGDMIHALGYTRYSGIGQQLGNIETVLRELRNRTGQDNQPLMLCVNNLRAGCPLMVSILYTQGILNLHHRRNRIMLQILMKRSSNIRNGIGF